MSITKIVPRSDLVSSTEGNSLADLAALYGIRDSKKRIRIGSGLHVVLGYKATPSRLT